MDKKILETTKWIQPNYPTDGISVFQWMVAQMDAERQKQLYERVATVYGALQGEAAKSEFLGLLLQLQNNAWDEDVWETLRRFRSHQKYTALMDYEERIEEEEE